MCKKLTVLVCLSALSFGYVTAQTITTPLVADLTPILYESSGITFIPPNSLFTHNDSGGNALVYELDTNGTLVKTIQITNAVNIDWEDITHDDAGNLYIGDFGNNNCDRTDLKIYKINNIQNISGNSATASVINFTLSDQSQFPPPPAKRNFDIEGMIWMQDSLWLFTKNRTAPLTGYCKIYGIPANTGNHQAQPKDSLFTCNATQQDCWITSAALSPDKSHLALLNGGKIFWLSCFQNTDFFKGKIKEIPLNTYTQKEGVTFLRNNTLFITDEYDPTNNNGGNLYRAMVQMYLDFPSIQITADTINCSGCTIAVDSATGLVQWSNGTTGNQTIANAGGWYTATATALNNCSVSDSIFVHNPAGLTSEGISHQSFIKVNTVLADNIKGSIYVNNFAHAELNLFDIQGRELHTISGDFPSGSHPFEFSGIKASGIYIIKLRLANETTYCKVALTH